MIVNAIIPPQAQGVRVDTALAELLPEYSRSQLSRWLKLGQLTLNQRHYQPKEKVYGDEQVQLTLESTPHSLEIQPEDIPLDICFEDEHCLILNKPQGLVVHPGAGNPTHTLVNGLLYYDHTLEQLPRAGIIHRLDKDTTGLLLVAKTLPAYTSLIQQMQQRAIVRRYLTLVHGHVAQNGIINTYYARHPHNRLKMAVRPQGKNAITHYIIRKRYAHTTLLEIKLITGRTHQIRVHMQYIKHPVVGDQLYGKHLAPHMPVSDLLNSISHQALHAYKLSLHHPITHMPITVEAALPSDWENFLTKI